VIPSETPGLWKKVDPTLVASPSATEQADGTNDTVERWRRYWRVRRPVLDVVGVVFWSYALLKIFVADIDERLVGGLAAYRFFLFVAIAAGLVLLLQRPGRTMAGFVYVVGYPVVVAMWKLPKWLYRTRSPIAFLAVGQVLTSLVGDVRHNVLAFAVAALSALAIGLATADVLLAAAGAMVAALAVYSIFRTIKLSVSRSRFMQLQQAGIRRVVDSTVSRGLMSPTDELRSAEVERFDATQQAAFLQNLGHAVIAHRAMHFWAYQLEAYRRSPATLFFIALSYFWLIVRTVAALSLLNLALYRADATAYAYQEPPTFLGLIRYSIASIYGAEIDAVHAGSSWADVIAIGAFIAGLIVVGSLLLSSALSFRAARDQSEIESTIHEIKRQGEQLDQRVQAEYEVSIAEAEARLEQLRWGLMGLINFFSTRMPRGPDLDST
jgi:hypothetical protein